MFGDGFHIGSEGADVVEANFETDDGGGGRAARILRSGTAAQRQGKRAARSLILWSLMRVRTSDIHGIVAQNRQTGGAAGPVDGAPLLSYVRLDCLARNDAMEWQLQDAKNHFSQLVQRARTQGPQTVTLRGERAVAVLSAQDYDLLRAGRPTLVDALLDGPSFDDELAEAIAVRAKRPSRDIVF